VEARVAAHPQQGGGEQRSRRIELGGRERVLARVRQAALFEQRAGTRERGRQVEPVFSQKALDVDGGVGRGCLLSCTTE
jgi:hypothetical protein